MSYAKSHVSSPHRFPHTCIFPCIIKSFLKQKIFVLAIVKFSWTNSDKILDHPPILFIWIDFDNNVDYPPIFIFGQTLIKFGGQPSEKNHLFMLCICTQYSQCPHALGMHRYCMVFIYLHACMHPYHPHKLHAIQLRNKSCKLEIFFFFRFTTRKTMAHRIQHHTHFPAGSTCSKEIFFVVF